MQGFKELVQPNIVLTAGFTATLNLKLEIGDPSQSVAVEGVEPVIDVKSVENATTFDRSADPGGQSEYIRCGWFADVSAVEHANPWQQAWRAGVQL